MSKKFNIVHKIQNFRKSVGFKFISVIRFVEKKMISAEDLIDSEKKWVGLYRRIAYTDFIFIIKNRYMSSMYMMKIETWELRTL